MDVNTNYQEYIYQLGQTTSTTTSNSTSSTNNSLDKDAFLLLLTTQMSNQDPLNPMEDKEFIAQLAQFSSLEQMQNLNKTFTSSTEEMLEAVDMMNLNQIQANVEILKEITNIRKAMDAYLVGTNGSTEESVEDTTTETSSIE